MRLAAVGVLACSRNTARIEGMLPEYDSASLRDVRRLLADHDDALAEVERLRAVIDAAKLGTVT
jgi:hypothetical protein